MAGRCGEKIAAAWAPACALYPYRYTAIMKPVCFLGDSLKCLREFPREARQDAGWQLDRLQRGYQPDDFKPMPSVGRGWCGMRPGPTG